MKLRLASTALDEQTVTLTLMQEGVTVGPLTVQSWGRPLGSTESASVTVEVTRSRSMTAPEGVFFNVTGWTGFDTPSGDVEGYDARQMDLIHIWSFGDPGSSYQVPEKLLPEWRDRNTARGPFVAHCYEGHGDHDWSLTVIEPSTGRIATASGRVTVADPDVTFAGLGTVYVSHLEDYSDCPASIPTNQRFSRLDAANDAIKPLTTGGRIMLARGEDYIMHSSDVDTSHDSLYLGYHNKGPVHLVAGPGIKTRPRLVAPEGVDVDQLVNLAADWREIEFVASGIKHKGLWDSRTETGQSHRGYTLRAVGSCLLNDCDFEDMGIAAGFVQKNPSDASGLPQPTTPEEEATYILANMAMSSLIVNDTRGRGSAGYAVYGDGIGKYAFLGCQMGHWSDARSGGNFRDPAVVTNNSGSVRIVGIGPKFGFVDGCDFFTRQGWFRNVKEFTTIQPNFRWNTSATPGCFLNMQRSSFEGGFTLVVNKGQNGNEVGNVSPWLMEQCILVASHMTETMIDHNGSGLTARNILAINPNRQSITSTFALKQVIRMYSFNREGTVYPETNLAKIEVSGMTFLDLTSTANALGQTPVILALSPGNAGHPPYGEVVEANNIVHRPNRDTPEVPFGPLDQTPLWAPREINGPIVSYTGVTGKFPVRFYRGDTFTISYPAGTTAADFVPPGQPTPLSRPVSGIPMTIEHLAEGVRITNVGTTASHDHEAGASYWIELQRAVDRPARYPQYASPLSSIWRATPLAGSPAIGGATSDDVPYADLRGRVRPIHPSVGAMEV